MGDSTESDISVLLESAPGDEEDFQPKNEVILLPGVFGVLLNSFDPFDRVREESTRRGGGRLGGAWEGGCSAMVKDRL